MMTAISDLFGPIFAKELIEMSRRWRYYLSRMLYGGALLLVLLLVFETTSVRIYYMKMSSTKVMAFLAEQFFLSVCWVQYFSVYIFVPLFVSGVISGEREQKTLDLLFTTQLSDREIIWGKLGSRITSLVMLILTALPIVAISMLFGGVNPTTLFRVTCATLLAVLWVSSFSLYFSVTTRSPLGAMIRTYWWGAVWLLLVPMVVGLIMEGFFRGNWVLGRQVAGTLALVHPASAFAVAVEDSLARQLGTLLGTWFFALLFIVPTLWSVYLIWRSVRLVRRDPLPGVLWRWLGQAGQSVKSRVWRRPEAGRPGRLARLGDPERAFFVMQVENPFWLRARRTFVYDREGHLRRVLWGGWAAAAGMILLLAAVEPRALHDDDAAIGFHLIVWTCLGVLSCLLAGYSLLGERRRGFFELVLTTPLTPREILLGTFLTIGRHVASAYLLLVALGIVFSLTRGTTLGGALCSMVTGAGTIALYTYFGLVCSLTARTIPGALIGTFCLPVVTLIGLPMISAFARYQAAPFLWWVCALGLPFALFLVWRRMSLPRIVPFLILVHLALASLLTCWEWGTRSFEYPIVGMHAGYLVVTSLDRHPMWQANYGRPPWMGVLLSYWLIVGLNLLFLHVWTCRYFDRLSGRMEAQRQPGRRAPHPTLSS